MRDLSAKPTPRRPRLVVPLYDLFPKDPTLGEMLYYTKSGVEGLYIYLMSGWTRIRVPNVSKSQTFTAEELQTQFKLSFTYQLGVNGLDVFVNGKKRRYTEIVEISSNTIVLKQPCQDMDFVEVVLRNPLNVKFDESEEFLLPITEVPSESQQERITTNVEIQPRCDSFGSNTCSFA